MQDQPALPVEESSAVLLVDDDATNIHVLHQTLEGRGYRLLVARSGEDALKIARRARPLLVLLDVMMPGIDGYETCRRLKEDPEAPDTAVIFLSALDDVKDKVRGFEAGAVDFITKPFQSDEIIARVQTHVAIQRMLRRSHDGSSPGSAPAEDVTTRRRQGNEPRPGQSEHSAGLERGRSVFRAGDVVAYRFRVVRYLAKGGMGELYEAEDLELHERVALKTILSTTGQDERSVLPFKREVHLARQVTHPNVCRIYDVFRHKPPPAAGAEAPAADIVFLAMELLHGETLADRLHREGSNWRAARAQIPSGRRASWARVRGAGAVVAMTNENEREKSMDLRRLAVMVSFVTCAAPAAWAQDHRVEIGAVAGYTLSDGVSFEGVRGGDGNLYNGIGPKDSFSWSLDLGFFVTPNVEVGFLFDKQKSKLELLGTSTREVGDMNVNNYHGYVAYNFGEEDATARPYLLGGLGATNYGAVGFTVGSTTRETEGNTQFSTTRGAGVKIYPSPKVGLKLGAR